MRTKAEEHFLKLVHDNRVDIFPTKEIPYVEVYIDNTKRALNKVASKRKPTFKYTYMVYHHNKFISLSKLIYMYQHNTFVPEKYQVIHKNLDGHDFRFENLDIMTHQEHQNYMVSIGAYKNISENLKNTRSKNAITNNPQTKLTIAQVEHYRCQYHQQKMTINAIMQDSGMQRRSVDNFLKFRSYSFDPITGEFDKELHLIYTDKNAKSYKKIIENPAPKKPKELKVKVVKENKVIEEKVCDLVKPKGKSKDSMIANIKPMKQPLSFNDCLELLRIKEKYNWVTSRIARETCLSEKIVERHIAMCEFFIDIFPNYTYINNTKRNELFDKFKLRYSGSFVDSTMPNIKPYSLDMLISLSTNVLREIYIDYRDNELSIEEIAEKHNYSEMDIKFGIVEYDRYIRPKHERRITPKQFHDVYSNM